ncbi:MAG: hypothetical protein LUC88_10610 [Prevotella sp.]|nr:hypothetical protein [Prevotella sp.]
MKKICLLKWGFLCLFCMLTSFGWAQATTTITWALNDCTGSTYNPSATVSTSGISNCTIDLGSSLSWSGSKSWTLDDWGGKAFAEVKASGDKISSVSDDTAIDFKIELSSGYTFKPTNVSLCAERDGTDGGYFSIYWIPDYSSVDTTNVVAKSLRGNRVSSTSTNDETGETEITTQRDTKYAEYSYDITADASSTTCGIRINIVNLDSGKSAGFADLVISGTVTDSNGDLVGDVIYSSAKWDWENDLPEGIQETTKFQGGSDTNTLASTVDGITMYVDATSGKLDSYDRVNPGNDSDGKAKTPAYDCQMNANTILRIPVVSAGDEVTVVVDNSSTSNGVTTDYFNYTIGGVAASSTTQTYTATDIDANRYGYVEIVATGGCYLKSISVAYVTAMTADDIEDNISSDLSEQKNEDYGYFDITISDPVEGDVDDETTAVESLSTITITADEAITLVGDVSSIVVTDRFGSEVATGSSYEDASEGNGYVITLSDEITTGGTYYITIPAATFTNASGYENSEISGYNVLVEPSSAGNTDEYTWVFNPEDGSTIIGSLDKITVTFDYDEDAMGSHYLFGPSYDSDDVTVYDEDGNDISESLNIDMDYSWEDDNVGYIIFKNPITNPGTYTIEIAENAFWVDDDNYTSEIEFKGTTLTYTIEAATFTCELVSNAIATDDEEETYYIKLKFDSAVKIDKEKTSISVDGIVEGADIIYDASNSDGADYATEWTLTFDGNSIADYKGQNLSLTVAAMTEGEVEETFDFTVATGDPDEWSFNPAQYTTFGTTDGNGLDKITVSCVNGITINGTPSEPVTITGVDNNNDEITLTMYSISVTESGDGTSCVIEPSSDLTTWGTYTVTIPEGYFLVGTDKTPNEETTLTYYVGETTGINGITLQAGSDGKIYNLNGQRVATPHNGVFILNGTKVLVK